MSKKIIGACAWMENEWMQTIDAKDKTCFRMKRYMDDIICVYATPNWWDHTRFIQDLEKSEIYAPPLTLEEGTQGTYLETRFRVQPDNTFSYFLKNDNEPMANRKFGGINITARFRHTSKSGRY